LIQVKGRECCTSGASRWRATSYRICSSASDDTSESKDLTLQSLSNLCGVDRLFTESCLFEETYITLCVQVSTDSEIPQSVESLHSALEVVDGVRRESNHLRIALGCSLPVSVTPESTSPRLGERKISSREDAANSSDGEVHAAVDVATAAGIEMVELLLAACEMQKGGLQRQIDFLAVQCKDSGCE